MWFLTHRSIRVMTKVTASTQGSSRKTRGVQGNLENGQLSPAGRFFVRVAVSGLLGGRWYEPIVAFGFMALRKLSGGPVATQHLLRRRNGCSKLLGVVIRLEGATGGLFQDVESGPSSILYAVLTGCCRALTGTSPSLLLAKREARSRTAHQAAPTYDWAFVSGQTHLTCVGLGSSVALFVVGQVARAA